MSDQAAAADKVSSRKRVQAGYVVSDRMDKTVVVSIERRTQHGLYKKYIRRSTRIKVHDADNACATGDFVEISEGRPRSAGKSWTLERIVEKANDPQARG